MIYEQLTDDECYLYALTQDESGLDLAEFCYIDETQDREDETDKTFRAWPVQYFWWRKSDQKTIDAGSRSVGKALAVDTPIFTLDGWKLMGDLVEGDYVLHPSGAPNAVIEAHKAEDDRPCYQIDFDNGGRIIADSNHLWVVWDEDNSPLTVTTHVLHRNYSRYKIPAQQIAWAGHIDPLKIEDWIYIESVISIESQRTRCITVESDDGMFLAGQAMIPTHNSLSIKFRAFAFPFLHPGQEMIVTAPEAIHLDAVTDNIETLYTNNKLASEMIVGGRGGIKHRPFLMNFSNGARIMGRIPQLDGRGVKGLHPIWLEHDEAQDYPEKGWQELVSTIKDQNPRARYRCHGVTRGVGDEFDKKITGQEAGWTITKLPAMFRPTWNEEERLDKIERYHGYDSPNYRRDVLGLPGDGSSRMFVLSRIFGCCETDMEAAHNSIEYYNMFISDAMIAEVESILDLVDIPAIHTEYKRIWIGMDFGWVQSPSAIVVFAEVRNPKKDETSLKLLTKIILKRTTPGDQFKVILHLMETYRPLGFAMDATGAGEPVISLLKDHLKTVPELSHMIDIILPYGFSEKVIVGFDETVKIDPYKADGFMEAAMYRPFLEASADAMRVLIDSGRFMFPFDKDLIGELQATPKNSRAPVDSYGKSVSRKLGQHTMDAIRMATLAYSTDPIRQMIAMQEKPYVPPPMIFLD